MKIFFWAVGITMALGIALMILTGWKPSFSG